MLDLEIEKNKLLKNFNRVGVLLERVGCIEEAILYYMNQGKEIKMKIKKKCKCKLSSLDSVIGFSRESAHHLITVYKIRCKECNGVTADILMENRLYENIKGFSRSPIGKPEPSKLELAGDLGEIFFEIIKGVVAYWNTPPRPSKNVILARKIPEERDKR